MLSVDHYEDDSDRALNNKVVGNINDNATVASGAAVLPADERTVRFNDEVFTSTETTGVTAKITWDLDNLSITSTTGYRDYKGSLLTEFDATEAAFNNNYFEDESEYISQEFLLQSNTDGPFEWMAGFYYLSEDAAQRVNVSTAPGTLMVRLYMENVNLTAYAGFVEGSYRFFDDKLKITVGGRYSKEEREFDEINSFDAVPAGITAAAIANGGSIRGDNPSIPNGALTAAPAFSVEDDWDDFTPRFNLQYFVNDDVMLYYSLSKGLKSGGYNFNQPVPVEPESILGHEIGVKAVLLGGRFRANLAAFYYDYEDIQLRVATIALGLPTTGNAEGATIKGIEGGFSFTPIDNLDLGLGFMIMSPEYDNLQARNFNNVGGALVNLDGGQLVRAPENSFLASASYNWKMPSGSLNLRGQYKYQDEIFFDVFEDPFNKADGYGLLSSKLTYRHNNDHWRVAVFAKNITNEVYSIGGFRTVGTFGTLRTHGDPRTYGIEVGYTY